MAPSWRDRPISTVGRGFGLNLVHTLSERWGVEHAVAGGTRVWAQLAPRPLTELKATA